MISILYNIIVGGCFGHKWEIVDKGKIADGKGTWYDLQCKKCGNMKCRLFQ